MNWVVKYLPEVIKDLRKWFAILMMKMTSRLLIMRSARIPTLTIIHSNTWTDNLDYDYSRFSEFFQIKVIYDAEEDDPAYHQRVLDNIRRKY